MTPRMRTLLALIFIPCVAFSQLGWPPGFSGGIGGVGFSSPSGPSYLLNDMFLNDLTAGNVNGTNATPTGGVRTVVDTETKISISSRKLSIASITTPGWDKHYLIYPALTRAAGRMAFTKAKHSNANQYSAFHLTTSAGEIPNAPTGHAMRMRVFPVALDFNGGGGAWNQVPAFPAPHGTVYPIGIVLRSVGAFGFVRSGSTWLLVQIHTTGNTATLYPMIQVFDAVSTYEDFVRIPTDLWLPTPLVSDGFGSAFGTSDGLGHAEGIAGGLGAGGGSQTWTGSTWAISGGKAVNTPTEGSELVTNGTFETDVTGWTNYSGLLDVMERNTVSPITGTGDIHTVSTSASSAVATQQLTIALGQWMIARTTGRKLNSSGTRLSDIGFGRPDAPTELDGWTGGSHTLTTANTTSTRTGRAAYTNPYLSLRQNGESGTTREIWADDLSVKQLTLSSLFASANTSTANVIASADVVVVSGTQAGVVVNLDNAGTPANFVIAYHNGTNVLLEKCVAGTYTTLINTAATYSANATLRVIKDGNSYDVYYNNAKVGSTQTISDAGIVSNTRHGLFSTHSGNTLDNFTVYARGTEGQYSNLTIYTQ